MGPRNSLDGCGKSRFHRNSEFLLSFSLCILPYLFLCPDCPAFYLCLYCTTHNTNIQAAGGIRTRNPSKRAAISPRAATDIGIRSTDRLTRSESLYRLSYPGTRQVANQRSYQCMSRTQPAPRLPGTIPRITQRPKVSHLNTSLAPRSSLPVTVPTKSTCQVSETRSLTNKLQWQIGISTFIYALLSPAGLYT